jgi:hypothetical protein
MHRINRAGVVLGSLLLLGSAAPGAAQPSPSWTDWGRVRNVPVGDKVIVTTTTGPGREYRMAFADDAQIVLARPLKRISAPVLEAMRRVGPNWPAVLGGREIVFERVRISTGAIREAEVRVAVLDVVPRTQVLDIRRAPMVDAADVLLGIAGTAAFFAASGTSGYDIEMRRRDGRPPEGSPLLPTLGTNDGVANARDIIYRAPARVRR